MWGEMNLEGKVFFFLIAGSFFGCLNRSRSMSTTNFCQAKHNGNLVFVVLSQADIYEDNKVMVFTDHDGEMTYIEVLVSELTDLEIPVVSEE